MENNVPTPQKELISELAQPCAKDKELSIVFVEQTYSNLKLEICLGHLASLGRHTDFIYKAVVVTANHPITFL